MQNLVQKCRELTPFYFRATATTPLFFALVPPQWSVVNGQSVVSFVIFASMSIQWSVFVAFFEDVIPIVSLVTFRFFLKFVCFCKWMK